MEADLGAWVPAAGEFDLVLSIYVHSAGPVEELVRRLAAAVAPGGTLLLVGDRLAAGQRQVSVEDARSALDPGRWELLVAEERPRPATGTGVDAVVRARRL